MGLIVDRPIRNRNNQPKLTIYSNPFLFPIGFSFYLCLLMNRSEFLKSIGIGVALCYANPWLAEAMKDPEFSRVLFGDSFFWGIATSAYQTEGAWNIDGKGESIWDKFSNKGKIKDNSTGNVASDFYHRYGSDLKLLKELNFKNFRFSFSWSRLLPEGT